MKEKLCFSLYGELYLIDLDLVMYLQADDHYTTAYYTSGTHFMIPFGLSKIETAIQDKLQDKNYLVRLSRKYIINTRCIFHINAVKQIVQLSDLNGNSHSLHLPKQVLRNLIESVSSAYAQKNK